MALCCSFRVNVGWSIETNSRVIAWVSEVVANRYWPVTAARRMAKEHIDSGI
jgi:hypothetical protein